MPNVTSDQLNEMRTLLSGGKGDRWQLLSLDAFKAISISQLNNLHSQTVGSIPADMLGQLPAGTLQGLADKFLKYVNLPQIAKLMSLKVLTPEQEATLSIKISNVRNYWTSQSVEAIRKQFSAYPEILAAMLELKVFTPEQEAALKQK
jgi:hypothetical protein